MSKLYSTINNDLVDPTLEAKVEVEPTSESEVVPIPDKLYAAITSKLEAALTNIVTTEPIAQTYVMPANKLYVQITPERPLALAEERSYVYVPKVTKDNAGIAQFETEQFTIINGKVFINKDYLNTAILMSGIASIPVSETEPLIGDMWFKVVGGSTPDIITTILSGGTFDEVPIDILLGGTFNETPPDTLLGGSY